MVCLFLQFLVVAVEYNTIILLYLGGEEEKSVYTESDKADVKENKQPDVQKKQIKTSKQDPDGLRRG